MNIAETPISKVDVGVNAILHIGLPVEANTGTPPILRISLLSKKCPPKEKQSNTFKKAPQSRVSQHCVYDRQEEVVFTAFQSQNG